MGKTFKDLGIKIKEARLKAFITQEKLAEIIGVGVTHISKIENGKSMPSLEVTIELMKCLQIEPNHLFSEYVYNVESVDNQIIREVAQSFEGCSSQELRKLRKQIRALREIDMETAPTKK